ncbi:HAMP domain-containing protein, partial [Streptomyces sp. GSL17-113]
ELALVLLFFGGAGILVAAAAGTAVARAGLRPVERLTAATERVTRSMDLRPIPVSGDDELARMTQSFNTMLSAVAESRDRQRRL